MRAILHIGMEKTGTTSLQAALSASRSMLDAAGFRYSRAAGKQGHLALPLFAAPEVALVDLMAVEGIADTAALERFRTRFRRKLTIEVGRRPDACFIFSSEHCHSRLVDDASIRRLHGLLAPLFDTIDIIVYLRRQDRVATSFYSTYLRGGGTSADIIPPPIAREYFDYAAMLARWTTVFGDRIEVVPYDRAADDVVRDFSDRVGLPALTVDHAGVGALNRSISAAGQEALRRFNGAGGDAPAMLTESMREALIAADFERNKGLRGRRPAREDARAFAGGFAESNAAVAERYLEGQAPFDDSFDDYPEREAAVDPDAVAAIFADALLRTENQRAALAAENAQLHQSVAIAATGNQQLRAALDQAAARNRDLAEENRNAVASVEIAARGNEQLKAALDQAVAGNRELDRMLGLERGEQRRLRAELGYYAGLVHFDAGRLDTARDMVAHALRTEPKHAALWHLMARVHHASGRASDALRAIDRAIDLDPGNLVHRDIRASFLAPPVKPPDGPVSRMRWFPRRL